MNVNEPLVAQSNALNQALDLLLKINAQRRARPQYEDELFQEMRDAARDICGGIQAVCNSGGRVIIHASRGSHRSHEIRKVGVLCSEVLLTYSPDAQSATCDHHCILTDASRIEAIDG